MPYHKNHQGKKAKKAEHMMPDGKMMKGAMHPGMMPKKKMPPKKKGK